MARGLHWTDEGGWRSCRPTTTRASRALSHLDALSMTQEEAHGEEKTMYVLSAAAQENMLRHCFTIQMWKRGVIQNPVIRLKCACLRVCVLNFFVLKSDKYIKMQVNYNIIIKYYI